MVAGHFTWQSLAQELFDEELLRLEALEGRAAPDQPEDPAEARDAAAGDAGRFAGAGRADRALERDELDPSTARFSDSPYWLLPELLRLAAEQPDRPVDELEPAIRELVVERRFVETAGDPVAEGRAHEWTVQFYVTALMRVLQRLRDRGLDTGAWSTMPTTPQMFG